VDEQAPRLEPPLVRVGKRAPGAEPRPRHLRRRYAIEAGVDRTRERQHIPEHQRRQRTLRLRCARRLEPRPFVVELDGRHPAVRVHQLTLHLVREQLDDLPRVAHLDDERAGELRRPHRPLRHPAAEPAQTATLTHAQRETERRPPQRGHRAIALVDADVDVHLPDGAAHSLFVALVIEPGAFRHRLPHHRPSLAPDERCVRRRRLLPRPPGERRLDEERHRDFFVYRKREIGDRLDAPLERTEPTAQRRRRIERQPHLERDRCARGRRPLVDARLPTAHLALVHPPRHHAALARDQRHLQAAHARRLDVVERDAAGDDLARRHLGRRQRGLEIEPPRRRSARLRAGDDQLRPRQAPGRAREVEDVFPSEIGPPRDHRVHRQRPRHAELAAGVRRRRRRRRRNLDVDRMLRACFEHEPVERQPLVDVSRAVAPAPLAVAVHRSLDAGEADLDEVDRRPRAAGQRDADPERPSDDGACVEDLDEWSAAHRGSIRRPHVESAPGDRLLRADAVAHGRPAPLDVGAPGARDAAPPSLAARAHRRDRRPRPLDAGQLRRLSPARPTDGVAHRLADVRLDGAPLVPVSRARRR
jgi:hypothetical protein